MKENSFISLTQKLGTVRIFRVDNSPHFLYKGKELWDGRTSPAISPFPAIFAKT